MKTLKQIRNLVSFGLIIFSIANPWSNKINDLKDAGNETYVSSIENHYISAFDIMEIAYTDESLEGSDAVIRVTDMYNQEFICYTVKIKNLTSYVPVSHLAAGEYSVVIQSEDKTTFRSLTKK